MFPPPTRILPQQPIQPARDNTVMSNFQPTRPGGNYLRINNLLNPCTAQQHHTMSMLGHTPVPLSSSPLSSAPPTPEYTIHGSTAASSSRPPTPATPNVPPKRARDVLAFTRGVPKQPVHYAPFELADAGAHMSPVQRARLRHDYDRFDVVPRGRREDGLIADFQRHIPYASDKKTFGELNRDGFEVFQYTFRMPGDPQKVYTVMWDYQIGLVRITPFFKALEYSKTTPARALATNEGLKDLSHSITGGSVAAQGYWMPFHCARAICVTFCHTIRWVLVPIFGYNFVLDCIPEHSETFGKFKIDNRIVQDAKRQAYIAAANDDVARRLRKSKRQANSPRSAPSKPQGLEPQLPYSGFRVGSAFDVESPHASYPYAPGELTDFGSPEVSPKTIYGSPVSGWTSINHPQQRVSNQPGRAEREITRAMRGVPPYGHPSFAHRHDPLKGKQDRMISPNYVIVDTNPEAKYKRRLSNDLSDSDEYKQDSFSGSSKSDEEDLIVVSANHKRQRKNVGPTEPPPSHKRYTVEHGDAKLPSESDDQDIIIPSASRKRSRKNAGPVLGPPSRQRYTTEEYDAAGLLLMLHAGDALSRGPGNEE